MPFGEVSGLSLKFKLLHWLEGGCGKKFVKIQIPLLICERHRSP